MLFALTLLNLGDRVRNYNFELKTLNKYLLLRKVLGKVWQAFSLLWDVL